MDRWAYRSAQRPMSGPPPLTVAAVADAGTTAHRHRRREAAAGRFGRLAVAAPWTIDFGITSGANLWAAYQSILDYAKDAPRKNPRLIARLELPQYDVIAEAHLSGLRR